MSNWKTILKRSTLALVAAAVAMSWTETGQAQAPCLIERGQDALDVLNTGVKHNVWIVLDTSDSMGSPTSPNSKISIAKATLQSVLDEFVDAQGKPLANWGFAHFLQGAQGGGGSIVACSAQFRVPSPAALPGAPTGCAGLDVAGIIDPPACGGASNIQAIKTKIGGLDTFQGTPNGMSMDQISHHIVSKGFVNGVNGLKANQKNFIILVSDGNDRCECPRADTSIPPAPAPPVSLDRGVWTPTPVPPFSTVDAIPRKLRGGFFSPAYTVDVGTGAFVSGSTTAINIQSANAGTKGRLAYERMNPSALDRATGEKGWSFVVGIDITSGPDVGVDDPPRTNHMAWEASGAFYGSPNAGAALYASSADGGISLKKALRDVFGRIGIPQSTVTLGSAVVGSVREVIPTFTNTAVTADKHIGLVDPPNVDADDIREARKVRDDHENNVIFSTAVDVPGFKGHFNARSIYRVTDPANPKTAREAFFQPIWDAGEKLQAMAPDSRNILFNKPGQTALLPFNAANVTPADLGVGVGYLIDIDGTGALTANDARDMVVGVIRGYRLSKDPITNKLYKPDGTINFSPLGKDGFPTWKLYEAFGALTVVQNPPRSPDVDPPQNHANEYGVGGSQAGDGFYWDHFNRQTMVYLPANGGMVHAFDAETGSEVFAYIPDDVMRFAPGEVLGSRDVLSEFVELVVAEANGVVNHQFFMAGSPTVKDVFLRSDNTGDDKWHTLLAFGRGRGGRFVTALDITDPLAPKLRFNKGNREGVNDGQLDGLGETWSLPVMGNVQTNSGSNPNKVDQWLLFLGGGYGCNNNAKEGHYLFALRAEDGAIYHRAQVTNNAAASIAYNAVVAMPVLYNPHQLHVDDPVDFVTRVYVGDVQGVIWKLVTKNLNPATWDFKKFAELGTNQPITAAVALLKDVNTQNVFVMAGTGGDLRVSALTNTFKFATFIDKDPEGVATIQFPLGAPPFFEKTLNPEERVSVAPVTIGRLGDPVPATVFFAASRSDLEIQTCTSKFFSTLFALGILSGQAEWDLDGGGKDESVAVEGKVTGLFARNKNLWVSQSGAIGSSTAGLTSYGDGKFSDGPPTGGGGMTIQLMVDSFRISPF